MIRCGGGGGCIVDGANGGVAYESSGYGDGSRGEEDNEGGRELELGRMEKELPRRRHSELQNMLYPASLCT